MANISGIVTDTGTTPIHGAVVWLEKSGQTTTTGEDGSFTFIVGSSGTLPGNRKLLANRLSAGISGYVMTLTIAERAAVKATIFDLSGKCLSIVRKTIDAGNHSIALPYQGDGIYLYKVQTGNSEFVIKGNSVVGVSSECSVTTQGSSAEPLAKRTQNTAAINDVIAATKTGYLNYRAVVTNSDTSGIAIKMIASAGTITDADSNVYQTVKIGNQVWMAENLRVTKYNDGSAIPMDTSTWTNTTTPNYCFYNLTTDSGSIKKYGALYNWYVVNPENPKKIAPAGWHVPTDPEWDTLQNYLIESGYNYDRSTTENKIAKSISAETDWLTCSTIGAIGNDLTINNRSGFSALPGGCRIGNKFNNIGIYCAWWSATEHGEKSAYSRNIVNDCNDVSNFSASKILGFSVRLIKD